MLNQEKNEGTGKNERFEDELRYRVSLFVGEIFKIREIMQT